MCALAASGIVYLTGLIVATGGWWRGETLGIFAWIFLSNDDIAERLFVSPLTAKTHVNRAMTKLNVRDRAQLVVLAYQSGLVRQGDPLPDPLNR